MSSAQIARVPLTAAQIYDKVHGGPGSAQLSNAQQAAASLRDRLGDCSHEVNALTRQMQEGWQGEAGGAAAGAAKPLADASDRDSDLLRNADTAIGNQIGAYDTVRNSVVPVPPDPPEMTSQGLFNTFDSGFSAYGRDLAEYHNTSQANVDAFAAYDAASTTNGQTVPSSYTTLTAPDSPITMTDGASAKDSGAKAGSVPTIGGSVGASGGAPASGPGGSSRTYQAPPQAGTPGKADTPPAGSASNDPGGTSASSYRPQPTPQAPQQGGYQFGPSGKPISNLNVPGPYGSGTGIVPTGGASGSGGAARTGGYRAGGIGGGGAGSGRANGSPGGGAPGQGRSGAGAPAPGRGTSAVPPGPTSAGGARGVPGASGGRGGAMPMGAGGGRGKGGEDEEHQRAEYLKNADPEETFGGSDLRATPPVIGEKRDK